MRHIEIYGELTNGRKWNRHFECYGSKNIEEVCSKCKLRFECYTEKDIVQLPITYLRKNPLRWEADVWKFGVRSIVKYFAPNIKVKFVTGKLRDKVQIDFSNVKENP